MDLLKLVVNQGFAGYERSASADQHAYEQYTYEQLRGGLNASRDLYRCFIERRQRFELCRAGRKSVDYLARGVPFWPSQSLLRKTLESDNGNDNANQLFRFWRHNCPYLRE